MDPATLRALSDVGTVALLIGVLWGGYKGWWIFGPMHRAIVADLLEQRDFWRQQALRSTSLSEKAVDMAVGEPIARHE